MEGHCLLQLQALLSGSPFLAAPLASGCLCYGRQQPYPPPLHLLVQDLVPVQILVLEVDHRSAVLCLHVVSLLDNCSSL